MHNMLAPVVDDGLLYFHISKEMMEKIPARFWRRLSFHPDQGGEGVASISHMIHRLRINSDAVYDWGHDTHKDLNNGLADAGMQSHMSMALLRVNIPASPWDTRSRWKQVIGRLDDMFRNESPATNAVFREMLPRLLAEPAGRQYRYEPDPEQALWNGMEERNAFSVAGAKVVKNRYCDVVRKLGQEVGQATQRKFGYLLTSMDMDMMTNGTFARLVMAGVDLNRTTNTRIETPEEKALRRSCANQMVVGLMSWMAPDTDILDQVAVLATETWAEWHGETSKELRSTSASAPFLLRQLKGEFCDKMHETWQATTDVGRLNEVGFTIPTKSSLQNTWEAYHAASREDGLFATLAHTCAGINGQRVRRTAGAFLSWNGRSVFFTEDTPRAQDEIIAMQEDHDNFNYLKSKVAEVEGLEDMIQRSPWNWISVEQTYRVLKEENFKINGRSQNFYINAHDRLIGSQVTEDAFNVQKNSTKHANRSGSIEEAWYALIDKQVASTKHNFEEVVPAASSLSRDMKVPGSAYKVAYKKMPTVFAEVTSRKSRTDWPSPKAQDWGVPFADATLISHCRRFNILEELQNAWLGGIFMPTSKFVAKRESGALTASSWLLPMGNFSGSAVVCWPVTECSFHGVADTNWYNVTSCHPRDVKDLLHAVVSPSEWKGREIKWMAPWSQALEFGLENVRNSVGGTSSEN